MPPLFGLPRAVSWTLAAASLATAAPVVLDVPEVIQEQTEWCWAGSTNAVLRYYKVALKQCEIAEYTRTRATFHDFGSVDCCKAPSGACNWWNYNWGVQSKGVGGTLSLAQVRTELEAKRPIIVRWAYKTTGGHFVVGHGLTDSSMHYMDPWPGEGSKIARFSWVVSNSQKDWDGTNVMTNSPVSGIGQAPRARGAGATATLTNSGRTLAYRTQTDGPVGIAVHSLRGELLWSSPATWRAAGLHEHPLEARIGPGAVVVHLHTADGSWREVVFAAP